MLTPGRIRVLVVDDSSTVRAVLRRLLSHAPDIEVVGEAANGRDAVEAALALRPQVVLMDIEMPGMDGYAATTQIMAVRPVPVVIVTSRANRDQARTAFEALKHGAVDVVAKPEHAEGWTHLAATLPDTVRALASGRRGSGDRPRDPRSPLAAAHLPRAGFRYVAVGASTGGPAAVRMLLAGIPAENPATILVVQHIATGFEVGFAEWLTRELSRDVQVARQGELALPGTVRIAPAGAHLKLTAGGTLELDEVTPPRGGHRPSVDELFLSCVVMEPTRTAGILLTGMGSDGAEGLVALHGAGALTLVQDESSSVVFGMPRAAMDRGAADLAGPPDELARILTRSWRGGTA